MRAIKPSRDIIPIGEFKARASELVRRVDADRTPVVITQNGHARAVVIPVTDFEELLYNRDLLGAIRRGLEEDAAGRSVTLEEADAQLDAVIAERARAR